MLSSKMNIALYALVAMLAVAPDAARAANCGGEPSVSSASSFQTWRRWCSCMGGTSASNLNDAQRQGGCRLPSGSGSSSSSTPSGGSIGTIIGTEIGKALSDALFGNPEADARRRAEERARAEEQRRAAEEMNRKQEEQKQRLLGGMMGVDGSPPLGLMGVESGPELSLMTDSASTIAPSVKAVPPAGKKSSSYTKGFEHASQCISQNAGSACAGVTADQQSTCVADYRGGYDSGSIQKNLFCRRPIRPGTAPPHGVNSPTLPRTRAPWGPVALIGSWPTTTDTLGRSLRRRPETNRQLPLRPKATRRRHASSMK